VTTENNYVVIKWNRKEINEKSGWKATTQEKRGQSDKCKGLEDSEKTTEVGRGGGDHPNGLLIKRTAPTLKRDLGKAGP